MHDDKVRVAFHARHPCGVAKRGVHVWCRRTFARRPFADKNFRAVAIRLVVMMRVRLHLHRAAVEVIVQHIGCAALHGRGRDKLQLGIFDFDRVEDLGEASVVTAGAVEPVLVANLNVFERERCRMTILRAACAPGCRGVTGHVFNLVERVLHIRLQVRPGRDVLVAQRVACIDREHWLHVEVFAPFEKFQQAHAVGGPVTPATWMTGAIRNRADGFFPIEPLRDGVAFDVIAARKTQERRLHVRHQLHDVFAVSIRAVVVSRRKERDLAEPDRAAFGGGNDQLVFLGGRHVARGQGDFVLLPLAGNLFHHRAGHHSAVRSSAADEADGQRTAKTFSLRIKRRVISRVGADGNPPVAGVGNAGRGILRGFLRLHFQAHVQRGIERLVGVERNGSTAQGAPEKRVRRVRLERAVAD